MKPISKNFTIGTWVRVVNCSDINFKNLSGRIDEIFWIQGLPETQVEGYAVKFDSLPYAYWFFPGELARD